MKHIKALTSFLHQPGLFPCNDGHSSMTSVHKDEGDKMKSLLNAYFIFCFLNFSIFIGPGQASVSVDKDITENWQSHIFTFRDYIDMNEEDTPQERHEYTIHRGLLAKMIKEQNDDISAVSTLDIIDTPVVDYFSINEKHRPRNPYISQSHKVMAPISLSIVRNSNLEHTTCNLRIINNKKRYSRVPKQLDLITVLLSGCFDSEETLLTESMMRGRWFDKFSAVGNRQLEGVLIISLSPL